MFQRKVIDTASDAIQSIIITPTDEEIFKAEAQKELLLNDLEASILLEEAKSEVIITDEELTSLKDAASSYVNDSLSLFDKIKLSDDDIQKMIDEEQECIDIVTQLTAVRSSINRTIGIVIGNKINQVIEEPVQDPELQEEKLAKVIEMIIKK